jgi:hypothetical protein
MPDSIAIFLYEGERKRGFDVENQNLETLLTKWVGIKDVVERAQVSLVTAYQWVAAKKIEGVMVLGVWRVNP